MHTIVILCALTTLIAGQPQCDPLTQYEKLGECCNMCGPGTSMSSLSTCLEPQCQSCDPHEYQDKHTKESKCQRQPFCDPNLHFQDPRHNNKKKTVCLCKEGYHCSTERCYGCEKHSLCQPGHGVKSEGTHSKDTVCEKCPLGTYSNETTASRECKKWTECETVQQIGTDTSDNICGSSTRKHLGLIAIPVALLIGVIISVVAVSFCKAQRAKGSFKLPVFTEAHHDDLRKPLKKPPSPAPAVILTILPEQPDDSLPRTPEENEHEPSQEILESMSDVGLTEKGQCVVQENGKTELLPRQESQTQTFSG